MTFPQNISSPGYSPKYIYIERGIFVVIVQSLSRIQLFVTPWTAACQASLSLGGIYLILEDKYILVKVKVKSLSRV